MLEIVASTAPTQVSMEMSVPASRKLTTAVENTQIMRYITRKNMVRARASSLIGLPLTTNRNTRLGRKARTTSWRADFKKTNSRPTLKPPAVDPEQAPININIASNTFDHAGHSS